MPQPNENFNSRGITSKIILENVQKIREKLAKLPTSYLMLDSTWEKVQYLFKKAPPTESPYMTDYRVTGIQVYTFESYEEMYEEFERQTLNNLKPCIILDNIKDLHHEKEESRTTSDSPLG